MAIARVAFADGLESGSTLTEATIGTWAAGDTCLINIRWYSATVTISSITLTGESAPSILGSPQTGGPNNARSQWALLSNVTGTGSKTANITMSGSPDQVSCAMWRLSGCDTAGAEDVRGGASGTSTTPTVGLTTTGAGAAIFAVVSNDNGDASTPGSGYAFETIDNIYYYDDAQYDVDVGAAGSKTVSMTLGGSGLWVINAIALKAAGGGGGGGQINAVSGIALTGVSAIDGIAKASISAINGLTI